jgi:spermidine synthase
MTGPQRRIELLRDLDRPTGWVLLVDGVEQSYVDVENPAHLEFEYTQHLALVVDAVFPAEMPLRVVHLGGGAMSLPRWVEHRRPGSVQTVVEISADVLAAVAGLGPVAGCTVEVGEALEVAGRLPAGDADLVVWDLYDGPRADVAALTLDAVVAMQRLLRPDAGLLLLNVSDVVPFDVVRPVASALQERFGDVALLAEPSTLRGRRSGNCVLAGSGRPLPVDLLARRAAAAPVRARVVAGAALDTLVGGARPATAAVPLPRPDPVSGRGFL